jgi:hypothetical protein
VAGVCTGYCPIEDLGSDPLTRLFWYRAYDCTNPDHPVVTVSTNRPHQLGGNCANCNDCIAAYVGRVDSVQAPPTVASGRFLRYGVFRKGVPNPRNSFAKCDEFSPGFTSAVLSEYTAEYRLKRHYLVRLFTVGSSKKPVHVLGLGWELDRKSPTSPFFVPHLSHDWIRSVQAVSGGHIVDVDQIGIFLVATMK